MAKIKRKSPVCVLEARRKGTLAEKERKAFLSKRYPFCIGTFPECRDLRQGEMILDCLKCPLYSKEHYEVNKMGKLEKKNVCKEKKPGNREERIQELLEKEKAGQIKPQERAWLTIYRKKGIIPTGGV